MFFWKNKVTDRYCQKTSLQASRKQIYPNMKLRLLNPKSKKTKRTLSFSPSEKKASICVEATLSFSFFLFFFINILSIILAFVSYTEEIILLQQQGKERAAYRYHAEGIGEDNEGLIVINQNKKIKSYFSVLPLPEYVLPVKCVVKPWTGYDVTKTKTREEEVVLVYITEYGTVYHKQRNCTHLSLSIQAASIFTVGQKRNDAGEIYLPCEYCGKNAYTSAVYITTYGNKYHTSISCRGLKRTIKTVPLSGVKGKDACKKCG